jgi:hypothetical protein
MTDKTFTELLRCANAARSSLNIGNESTILGASEVRV